MRVYKNIPDNVMLDCRLQEQKELKTLILKEMLDKDKWGSISEFIWPLVANYFGRTYVGKSQDKDKKKDQGAGHYGRM